MTWRPVDLPGLELRRGVAVTEPYPRHWHEDLQLCLATGGRGVLEYRRRAHPTPTASLFIVHPGEVHANAADDRSGCSFRSLYLPVDAVRRIASDVAGRGRDVPFFPRSVIVDGDIVERFAELHRALEWPGARLAAETLLLELFARLIARHADEPCAVAATRGRERPAVRRARDYLSSAFTENVSLGELARVAGLSPWHLSRAFSDDVGIPPHAYQMQLRILDAKRKIRAGHALAAVASATGFVDQSHFTRHFKRLVKLTPGQYLRASKNVQDRPSVCG